MHAKTADSSIAWLPNGPKSSRFGVDRELRTSAKPTAAMLRATTNSTSNPQAENG
jgi:ATPase family associated with various cellular activities (AAA)